MAGTIRPVTITLEGSYAEIKTLVKCDMIDIVRVNGFDIIMEDRAERCRALHHGGRDSTHAICGKLLVTKADRLGELIDVTESIEAGSSMFIIVRPVLRPVIVVSERPGVIAAQIVHVEIFLDRSMPKTVETVEA